MSVIRIEGNAAAPQSPAAYERLAGVLNDRSLSAAQKRARLADWASDRYAVPDKPWLRAVPGADEPLPLAAILAALCELDGDDPPPRPAAAKDRREVEIAPPADAVSDDDADFRRAAIDAHSRNIGRYARLLASGMSEVERAYLRRRIAEERIAIERLQRSERAWRRRWMRASA